MEILMLGASGGVGRQAVQVAREAGHHVVAAARARREPTGDAPEAPDTWGVLEHQALDVRDRAAMLAALEGVDVVMWCVGVTKSSGGDVGTAAVSKRDIASAMVNLAQGRQWIAASPFLHAGRG